MENNSLLLNDLIHNTNSLFVELKRQTSTPLLFHAVNLSTMDESTYKSISKINMLNDIVNELTRGDKGLDKLLVHQQLVLIQLIILFDQQLINKIKS